MVTATDFTDLDTVLTEAAPLEMRKVLGHFATGVVAITGIDADGAPTGLAANSFTSVSLEPPLVAFCVARTSTSWPRLRSSDAVAINILSDGQEHVCRQLSTRGPEKFRGLGWCPSPSGAPILDDSLACLEVTPEVEHPAGDHTIVVCRVRRLRASALAPLIFFRGAYGEYASTAAGR